MEKSKRAAVLAGLAEILESPITAETELATVGTWDSMAVVMTVALIDDHCGVAVDGVALGNCATVADVLKLAGAES